MRMIFWFTDYHLFHSPVCVLRVSLSGSSLIGPRPPSKDRILFTDTNFSPYLSSFFFLFLPQYFSWHIQCERTGAKGEPQSLAELHRPPSRHVLHWVSTVCSTLTHIHTHTHGQTLQPILNHHSH